MGNAVELAGVDLAWMSERNATAMAFGHLEGRRLTVTAVLTGLTGLAAVSRELLDRPGLAGVAIDAPLIITNVSGQRDCERALSREYGARKASCHASNLGLYPDPASASLSDQLLGAGFEHLKPAGCRWQIECYPHPAIIELFDLPERLSYKKGTVRQRREGQVKLCEMLATLADAPVLALDLNGADLPGPDRIDALSGNKGDVAN